MAPLRQSNPIDAAKLATDYTEYTDFVFYLCLPSFGNELAGFLSQGRAIRGGVGAGRV